jgi:pimeloyl-ACP methyl ester carboxylesterase/DNA-binding CsgD family transcriptional regulator
VVGSVQYAHNEGSAIAYQVTGDADLDLVLVPGFVSHLDLAWDEPHFARFLRKLSSFSRLIRFDKRGTGLSDPAEGACTFEQETANMLSVLDAAGARRPVLFGVAVGAAICMSLARRSPERTRSLVLWGAHARLLRAPGYPAGWTPEFYREVMGGIDQNWADGSGIEAMNPTLAHDERYRSWFIRHARAAASPRQVKELFRLCASTDLRPVLSEITAPTLLLHNTGDPWMSVEHSRYVAEHLPGSRLVELPGVDHWPWIADMDAVLSEVEAFATGTRPHRTDRPAWGPDALTRRERDVMALAVQGLTARDIAERLFISTRTVETHIANSYTKLGVSSRVELVRLAAQLGL